MDNVCVGMGGVMDGRSHELFLSFVSRVKL